MAPHPRKIIIDTDPGQDDAVAILLALASPELDVLGITTVAGNVPLALTARNARIVCELAGRSEVKVFAGCDRPRARPSAPALRVASCAMARNSARSVSSSAITTAPSRRI